MVFVETRFFRSGMVLHSPLQNFEEMFNATRHLSERSKDPYDFPRAVVYAVANEALDMLLRVDLL